MRSGRPAKRSRMTWKCWRTSSVVGARIATCWPAMATANAARSATSVLPKPTSPQISRSIGWPEARSSSTASIAAPGPRSRRRRSARRTPRTGRPAGHQGALARRALGGDLDQLARDLADPLLDLGLARLPAEPAQLVELDRAVGRAVAREHVQVLDRHEQLVAALVDQAQAVVRRAGEAERDQAVEAADAVVAMHHQIALAERGDLGDELVRAARLAHRPAQAVADDVGLGEHRDLRVTKPCSSGQHGEPDAAPGSTSAQWPRRRSASTP